MGGFWNLLKNKVVLVILAAACIVLAVYIWLPFLTIGDLDWYGLEFTGADLIVGLNKLSRHMKVGILLRGLTFCPVVAALLVLLGVFIHSPKLVFRSAIVGAITTVALPVWIFDKLTDIIGINHSDLELSEIFVFEFVGIGFWITLAAMIVIAVAIGFVPHNVFNPEYYLDKTGTLSVNEDGIYVCPSCGKEYDPEKFSNFCPSCCAPLRRAMEKTERTGSTGADRNGGVTCKSCGAQNDPTNAYCTICGNSMK